MSPLVTPHFALVEFACKSGVPYPISTIDDDDRPQHRSWWATRLLPLCELFEIVRAEAGGGSITIDSGYRTPEYDQKLLDAHLARLAAAGLPNDGMVAEPSSSEHPRGRAADIVHATLTPMQLFNLITRLYQDGRLPRLGGIGLYSGFVHVDIRPKPPNGHLAIWGATRPSNIV